MSPSKHLFAHAFLLLGWCACASPHEDTGEAESTDPFEPIEATGVIVEAELTVSEGGWTVQRDDGESLAEVSGYHINGQFIGPTLVCDLGDTLRVTLNNDTNVAINLRPHGLHVDATNAKIEALPGETVSFDWEATEGAGTFYYAATHLDEAYFDDQALSGVIGLIVVRSEIEEDLYQPTQMINYIMLDLYEPAVAFNWDILDPQDEVHNFMQQRPQFEKGA